MVKPKPGCISASVIEVQGEAVQCDVVQCSVMYCSSVHDKGPRVAPIQLIKAIMASCGFAFQNIFYHLMHRTVKLYTVMLHYFTL